jgi:hypothetical protein
LKTEKIRTFAPSPRWRGAGGEVRPKKSGPFRRQIGTAGRCLKPFTHVILFS